MNTFQVGTEVEWSSGANGTTKHKRGVIVEVVPPRTPVKTRGVDGGRYNVRDHESYVVRVERTGKDGQPIKPAFYFPRTSHLRAA